MNNKYISIKETNFTFPGQTSLNRGKVRDNYYLKAPSGKNLLVSISTGRISAYNQLSENVIPDQGAILTGMSASFYSNISSLADAWVLRYPHRDVMVGYACTPLPYELIIRNYMTGSLFEKYYREGRDNPWGYQIESGLQDGDKLTLSLFTPTRKSKSDPPISENQILTEGVVSQDELENIKQVCFKINDLYQKIASGAGLILVDFKLEMGRCIDDPNRLMIIDEGITMQSARFWSNSNYQEYHQSPETVTLDQLSKQFYRNLIKGAGFDNTLPVSESNPYPVLSDEQVSQIRANDIQIYKTLTGKVFHESLPMTIEEYLDDMHSKIVKFITKT